MGEAETVELDAIVQFNTDTTIHRVAGKAAFSFVSSVDPWAVHACFSAMGSSVCVELDREHLVKAGVALSFGVPLSENDWAPVQVLGNREVIVFRLRGAEAPNSTDFAVDRMSLGGFLVKTNELCGKLEEDAALAAEVERGLSEL